MMRHHEIFGIGLSNYDRAMGPYWLDLTRVIYPHNILLNFWTVTGVLGVVAFFWILIAALWTTWRGWRAAAREWAPVQLGVFLALLAVLAHGLVDVPYFKNDLSLEFWALLGLSYAGWRWARGPAPPRPATLAATGA
jgi:O-antigen ligase